MVRWIVCKSADPSGVLWAVLCAVLWAVLWALKVSLVCQREPKQSQALLPLSVGSANISTCTAVRAVRAPQAQGPRLAVPADAADADGDVHALYLRPSGGRPNVLRARRLRRAAGHHGLLPVMGGGSRARAAGGRGGRALRRDVPAAPHPCRSWWAPLCLPRQDVSPLTSTPPPRLRFGATSDSMPRLQLA